MITNNMPPISVEDLFTDFSFTRKQLPLTPHEEDSEIFNLLKSSNVDFVVAGGAALAWYQRQPVGYKDIDLWFKNKDSLEKFSSYIKDHGILKFQSDDAETWGITIKENSYRIQLIKRYNPTMKDIVESFDITVCQVATNGERWYYTSEFIRDLKLRKLVFARITPGSVKRLLKYWSYGFEPDSKTIKTIMNDPNSVWDYTLKTEEDYHNAF